MTRLLIALVLVSSYMLAFAQDATSRNQTSVPCTVDEQSIFRDARICGKSREGSLTKADLTVAEFTIGNSTLEDIAGHFSGSHEFKLSKEMEASTGVCVKNKVGDAVVFSSGDLAEPKVLSSIYLARAEIFEKQGAMCLEVPSLPGGASTRSGIELGMKKERALALFRVPQSKVNSFSVDYSIAPEKAPWVSTKFKRRDAKGWVAMSGLYGGFRNGRLRWIVLYASLSN